MQDKHTLKQKIDALEKKYSDLTFAIDRGFVSDTTEMCCVQSELSAAKKEFEKLLNPHEWIEFKLSGKTVNEKKLRIDRHIEACVYKISIINEYGDTTEFANELKHEKEKLRLLRFELEKLG